MVKIDAEVKEQKEQKVEDVQPREPKFDDIESSYLYWRNYLPETPYQEYIAKKKCVSMGKELLPTNKESNEVIEAIYKKATDALNNAKPEKRDITFKSQDIAGKKYPVYYLSAKNVGDCQAETERLDYVRMDFKNQQYEYVIGQLQEVDDEIFHELIKKKIIPVEAIDPKKIMDKTLREGGFDVLFVEDIPLPEKETTKEET